MRSRNTEIENVQVWACFNNLCLNGRKSVKIVFSLQQNSSYSDISRVSSLKILGVIFFSRLSVADHVQNVVSSCAETLHALKLLRVYTACLMQRYSWSTELSSSPDCWTRLVGFHYRRRPATYREISTPRCMRAAVRMNRRPPSYNRRFRRSAVPPCLVRRKGFV